MRARSQHRRCRHTVSAEIMQRGKHRELRAPRAAGARSLPARQQRGSTGAAISTSPGQRRDPEERIRDTAVVVTAVIASSVPSVAAKSVSFSQVIASRVAWWTSVVHVTSRERREAPSCARLLRCCSSRAALRAAGLFGLPSVTGALECPRAVDSVPLWRGRAPRWRAKHAWGTLVTPMSKDAQPVAG